MSDNEFIHKPAKRLNYHDKVKAGIISGFTQRSSLKKASCKKQKWLDAYNKLKDESTEIQKCQRCNSIFSKSNSPPHHPRGRVGNNILCIMWLCFYCHKWVHENANQARKEGYLEM